MRVALCVLVLSSCGTVMAVTDSGIDAAVRGDDGLDAGNAVDSGSDAGLVDAGLPDAGVSCSGSGRWVCSADGNSRERCVNSRVETANCATGCLRSLDAGTDATCLGAPFTLSCPGSYGLTRSTIGDYYLTAFGCWVDAAGVAHGDPGDNCIPTCLARAKSAGLCPMSDTGKQCEERVTWFTADGARFGCLARLRVTNPANGKSVIAVALDYGPACRLETAENFPILDASGRVDRYLFGSDQGSTDHARVHVVEVDQSIPLGPVP